MRHGVCYAIIREFNLNSCTLRHLDRYLEESVERVGRVLPLAAVLQSLSTVDFVGADNTVGVQVGLPRHNRHAVLHFDPCRETRRLVRRTDPRDILLPHLCRTAARLPRSPPPRSRRTPREGRQAIRDPSIRTPRPLIIISGLGGKRYD